MLHQGLSIETATMGNIEEIASLHNDCFSRGWDAGQIYSLMNNTGTKTFLAKIQTSKVPLVGLLMFRCILNEIEILSFCVSPSIRRKGVASRLLTKLVYLAIKFSFESIFLEVAENNICAKHLYQKYGFEEVGKRKNYYKTEIKTINASVFCLKRNMMSKVFYIG